MDYLSLNLNYDLISSLLGFINIAEDEEYNASYEQEISLVDKIEADISDIYNDEESILSKIQEYCRQLSFV